MKCKVNYLIRVNEKIFNANDIALKRKTYFRASVALTDVHVSPFYSGFLKTKLGYVDIRETINVLSKSSNIDQLTYDGVHMTYSTYGLY